MIPISPAGRRRFRTSGPLRSREAKYNLNATRSPPPGRHLMGTWNNTGKPAESVTNEGVNEVHN